MIPEKEVMYFKCLHILVTTAFLFSFFAYAENKPSDMREAFLSWEEVPGAISYEVQVSKESDFSNVIFSKKMKVTEVKFKLAMGIYYMQIRAVDARGVPGPWSEPDAFAVNSRIPKPLSPAPSEKIEITEKNKSVNFSWEAGAPGTAYMIEIKDEQGVLVQRRVDQNKFSWRPKDAGTYSWRVGLQNQSGREWGEYSALLIEGEYLNPALLSAPVVNSPSNVELIQARQVFIHLAQGYSAYSSMQEGTEGESSTSITQLGLEGRFQKMFLNWQMQFSGKFGIEKRNDDNESLSRVLLAAAFLRPLSSIQWGPIFELGQDDELIPIHQGIVVFHTDNQVVSRNSFGIGLKVQYLNYFSQIKFIQQSGGSVVVNTEKIKLDSCSGIQLSFGANYFLNSRWSLEGQAIYDNREFKWRGSSAAHDALFFNFGLGVSF